MFARLILRGKFFLIVKLNPLWPQSGICILESSCLEKKCVKEICNYEF